MAPPNGPVESVPNKPPVPEQRVEQQVPALPDGTQRSEVPPSEQEKTEVKLATAEGEEGLHQQTAASRLEQYQPPSKSGTPEEEDLGTSKGAMDKISDGMQKMFELIQKFMKQIQAMGSSTLRGMASTLAMLGFKKAAEWLNEMAGADYAELMTAMKKNNLKLVQISPEDPEAKAKGEAAERGQAQLADRFKALAPTRGPSFTREMYYSEVVTAWKKKGGNGGKTDITHNDLLDMAVTAQELPAALPGQVAQAPEFVQPLDSLVTPMNIMGGTPTKISVLNNKRVAVQAFPNGEISVAVGDGAPVRYHLTLNMDGFSALQWSLQSAQLSKDGLLLAGEASHIVSATGTTTNMKYPSRLIPMAGFRSFLESVVNNPNGAPVPGTDFRFERI